MKVLILGILLCLSNQLIGAPPPLPHEPGIYGRNYTYLAVHKKSRQQKIREQAIIDFGRIRDEALRAQKEENRRISVDLGSYLYRMSGSTRFWVNQNMKQARDYSWAKTKLEQIHYGED